MTDSEKLTKSKDVIAYLAAQFPQCFSEKGEPKPLKIGIFDDLAKRLENDEKVSKTRLRTALRHYTNSWRYLRSVKAGVARVDLDGSDAGIVDEGHQQHAQEELNASRQKAAEQGKLKTPPTGAKKPSTAAAPSKTIDAKKRQSPKRDNKSQGTAKTVKKPAAKLVATELSDLQSGQQVQVKVGSAPMPATIIAIERDDVQVQLQNGLTMKVGAETIFRSE